MEKNHQQSWLANQTLKDVLKMWKTFHVAIWAQPKSWILSELFEKAAEEIDRNFGAQKREIALIIDNYPAHPDVPALDWLEPKILYRVPLDLLRISWNRCSSVLKNDVTHRPIKSKNL